MCDIDIGKRPGLRIRLVEKKSPCVCFGHALLVVSASAPALPYRAYHTVEYVRTFCLPAVEETFSKTRRSS